MYMKNQLALLLNTLMHIRLYSTGCSQHDTDFAKMNQNEVVRIHMNFFEYF